MREGIAEVFHELQQLHQDTEYTEVWDGLFKYQLWKIVCRKVKLERAQSVKSVSDESYQTAP